MRVAAFDTRGVGRAFKQPTSCSGLCRVAGSVPSIGFAGVAGATIASRLPCSLQFGVSESSFQYQPIRPVTSPVLRFG
jgi:hypothetical protein